MRIFERIILRAKSFEPTEHPFLSIILNLIGSVSSVVVGCVVEWIVLGILLLPIIFIVFRAPIILFFRTQFRLIEMIGALMFAGLCTGLSTLVIRSQDFGGEDLDQKILAWMVLSFVSVMVGSAWAWKKIYDLEITNAGQRWKLLMVGWIYALMVPLVITFFLLLLPIH